MARYEVLTFRGAPNAWVVFPMEHSLSLVKDAREGLGKLNVTRQSPAMGKIHYFHTRGFLLKTFAIFLTLWSRKLKTEAHYLQGTEFGRAKESGTT